MITNTPPNTIRESTSPGRADWFNNRNTLLAQGSADTTEVSENTPLLSQTSGSPLLQKSKINIPERNDNLSLPVQKILSVLIGITILLEAVTIVLSAFFIISIKLDSNLENKNSKYVYTSLITFGWLGVLTVAGIVFSICKILFKSMYHYSIKHILKYGNGYINQPSTPSLLYGDLHGLDADAIISSTGASGLLVAQPSLNGTNSTKLGFRWIEEGAIGATKRLIQYTLNMRNVQKDHFYVYTPTKFHVSDWFYTHYYTIKAVYATKIEDCTFDVVQYSEYRTFSFFNAVKTVFKQIVHKLLYLITLGRFRCSDIGPFQPIHNNQIYIFDDSFAFLQLSDDGVSYQLLPMKYIELKNYVKASLKQGKAVEEAHIGGTYDPRAYYKLATIITNSNPQMHYRTNMHTLELHETVVFGKLISNHTDSEVSLMGETIKPKQEPKPLKVEVPVVEKPTESSSQDTKTVSQTTNYVPTESKKWDSSLYNSTPAFNQTFRTDITGMFGIVNTRHIERYLASRTRVTFMFKIDEIKSKYDIKFEQSLTNTYSLSCGHECLKFLFDPKINDEYVQQFETSNFTAETLFNVAEDLGVNFMIISPQGDSDVEVIVSRNTVSNDYYMIYHENNSHWVPMQLIKKISVPSIKFTKTETPVTTPIPKQTLKVPVTKPDVGSKPNKSKDKPVVLVPKKIFNRLIEFAKSKPSKVTTKFFVETNVTNKELHAKSINIVLQRVRNMALAVKEVVKNRKTNNNKHKPKKTTIKPTTKLQEIKGGGFECPIETQGPYAEPIISTAGLYVANASFSSEKMPCASKPNVLGETNGCIPQMGALGQLHAVSMRYWNVKSYVNSAKHPAIYKYMVEFCDLIHRRVGTLEPVHSKQAEVKYSEWVSDVKMQAFKESNSHSIFVKLEKYCALNRNRVITNCDKSTTVQLLRYVYPLHKRLSELVPAYAPGKDKDELSWHRVANHQGLDCSGLDGTISYKLRRLEYMLFKRIYPTHYKDIERLLDNETLGVFKLGKIRNVTLTLPTMGSRLSGSALTSIANTLLMMFLQYYFYRVVKNLNEDMAFKSIGYCYGDDTTGAREIVAELSKFVDSLGIKLTLEKSNDNRLCFLSEYMTTSGKVYDMKRLLSKALVYYTKFSEEKGFLYKCMGYYNPNKMIYSAKTDDFQQAPLFSLFGYFAYQIYMEHIKEKSRSTKILEDKLITDDVKLLPTDWNYEILQGHGWEDYNDQVLGVGRIHRMFFERITSKLRGNWKTKTRTLMDLFVEMVDLLWPKDDRFIKLNKSKTIPFVDGTPLQFGTVKLSDDITACIDFIQEIINKKGVQIGLAICNKYVRYWNNIQLLSESGDLYSSLGAAAKKITNKFKNYYTYLKHRHNKTLQNAKQKTNKTKTI
jgi:hypothetical protein